MKLSSQIKPISYLKANAAEVVRGLAESGEPMIITQNGDLPPEALRHYADQSHLIREVKRVTGQTPRQLRTQASPTLRKALHPSNLWELHDRGCNSD
mgnify:CR=1 FL=1